MPRTISRLPTLFALASLCVIQPALAADWPHWGGGDGRNMASDATGLPASFDPGQTGRTGREIDLATTKNVKWAAPLGTQTYGNPVISGGRVLVGTNDAWMKDPRFKRTRGGMLLCFDEATGKRLWQLVIPRFITGSRLFNFDNLNLGTCSAAAIEGDRAYLLNSRGDVLCLDMTGQANGNDGPFTDEGQYMAEPGKAPVRIEKTDGDIVWRFDTLKLPVQPQDASSSAVLIHGDLIYVGTSNGVDRTHKHVPYPDAPTLIVLHKGTGRLVAVDDVKINRRLFHGNWSSPSLAIVDGKPQILFGGGDGVCYAFAPADPNPPAGTVAKLKMIWSYDCNPPESKVRDGKPTPYELGHRPFRSEIHGGGPSEIIATPVFHAGRVYVAVGQDPRHGCGKGALSCIDPTGTGDISKTGTIWRSTDVDRSLSTVSVADGLLYIADYSGQIHCFDAATGKRHWMHETHQPMWSSTFLADGKLYFGNENHEFHVLQAGKTPPKPLAKIKLHSSMANTPVVANGVLFVASQKFLYAIQANPGAAK